MDIREQETVEAPSPVRREPGVLSRLLAVLVLLGIGAGVAIALSPGLRGRLFGSSARTVAVSIQSTPPGADVFIDEQPAGATPTSAEVSPGEHAVRIVRSGYKPWRGVLDTGRATTICPTLEPLELATLIVESEPDGAKVFLDDDYRDTTPVRIEHVEAGAHTVRIIKEPVYRPVVQHIELKPGETRRISVQLESGLEELYEERIEANPKKLSNYAELLHLHVINGRTDKAVAVAMRGLKALEAAEPPPDELGSFYEKLANVYRGRAGPIDDATRSRILDAIVLLFAKLVKANPEQDEYYRPIVTLLGQQGHFDRILEVCNQTANGPAAGEAHVRVARMFLGWGELKNAIALLEQAVKLKPASFDAHYRLATAYQRADRPDEALREYQAAEKLSAGASVYYQGLVQTGMARLLSAKGDVDGAVARYEQALKLKISSYYACRWRLEYAELLAEKGRKQEAIKQYREVLRVSRESKFGREAARALRRLGSD